MSQVSHRGRKQHNGTTTTTTAIIRAQQPRTWSPDKRSSVTSLYLLVCAVVVVAPGAAQPETFGEETLGDGAHLKKVGWFKPSTTNNDTAVLLSKEGQSGEAVYIVPWRQQKIRSSKWFVVWIDSESFLWTHFFSSQTFLLMNTFKQ